MYVCVYVYISYVSILFGLNESFATFREKSESPHVFCNRAPLPLSLSSWFSFCVCVCFSLIRALVLVRVFVLILSLFLSFSLFLFISLYFSFSLLGLPLPLSLPFLFLFWGPCFVRFPLFSSLFQSVLHCFLALVHILRKRAMSVVETFHGYIETTQDSLLVFEACRRCLLPRASRRLQEKERQLVRSGSVFVFDEKESGMRDHRMLFDVDMLTS